MSSILYDAGYWRDRAEEARALSGQMTDPTAKATLLRIAEGYDKLAEHTMAHASGTKPNPSN